MYIQFLNHQPKKIIRFEKLVTKYQVKRKKSSNNSPLFETFRKKKKLKYYVHRETGISLSLYFVLCP